MSADRSMIERSRRRFPDAVYAHGAEPDPRFSLANERTFLAWIRTSLALLAAGVALEALEVPLRPGLRIAAAAVFVGLALLGVAQAWFGWVKTERSLRAGAPRPSAGVGSAVAKGCLL
jgi:putative membrane protein